MVFTFHFTQGILKFARNRGQALVVAHSPETAISRTRELFPPIRDIYCRARGSQEYLVSFKVSLDYRRHLLKAVDRAWRLFREPHLYPRARYIDRYIVATLAQNRGKPDWLYSTNLKEERRILRKAAVVAREVPNIMRFVDWDVAIWNYLELNSKPGHRSRVVRRPARKEGTGVLKHGVPQP